MSKADSEPRAPSCKPTLPTLDEIPQLKSGGARDWKEMLWLTMIPAEDAALRAAAVGLYNKSEEDGPSLIDDLKALSSVPAKTAGGLAWKLAMILRHYEPDDDERWTWPTYLLESALVDALEHERTRRSPVGSHATTKITEAYQQWVELWREYPTDQESNAAREARTPLENIIADERATCLEDVICKLKMLRELDGWVRGGEIESDAIACLERLVRRE